MFAKVFEGIAIGLQDNSGQFASIVIAVIVHKVVMAFSLGLNIAQSDLNKRNFLLSTVIFSLASPVGVIIGILMMGLPPSLMRDVCNGFLQGQYLLIIQSTFYSPLLRDCRRNLRLHYLLRRAPTRPQRSREQNPQSSVRNYRICMHLWSSPCCPCLDIVTNDIDIQ